MRKRIINTGKHLPKATWSDVLELRERRNTLVRKPLIRQAKRTGNVFYGGQGVNMIVGTNYERHTHDFDVFSRHPKRHAIEIERGIDRGVNADLAYVEQTRYIDRGRANPLFRVKIRPYGDAEVDFNLMPRDIRTTTVKGVRVETLDRAEGKYKRMLRRGERGFNANIDLTRIQEYKLNKKRR